MPPLPPDTGMFVHESLQALSISWLHHLRLCCLFEQDFLQVLSMFAGFGFVWPPQVLELLNALTLFNFNFDLLAPECSVSIDFETKWYIIQSLPLTLAVCIAGVVCVTKGLQFLQRTVLGVLPFGALSAVSLVDVCLGMLISGIFMMYFGTCSHCRAQREIEG